MPCRESNSESSSEALCDSLDNLAALYYQRFDFEKAEEFSRRALITSEQTFGRSALQTAARLNNLGSVLAQMERREEAHLLRRRGHVVAVEAEHLANFVDRVEEDAGDDVFDWM